MSIRKLRITLDEAGLSEVGVSYVGGMTFMLTFNDKASAFYLWNGEDIPFSRVAKVNISGVPFVIRDNKLFDKIGSLFGTVVQPSSFSWQQEDNSSGTVVVLTNQLARIEEAVVIKWKEKTVVAWASEYMDLSIQSSVDDFSLINSESELDSESDSECDEDMEGMEDLEEGEMRPNVSSDEIGQDAGQSPATAVEEAGLSGEASDSPVELVKSQGGEEAPAHQRSPTVNTSMGNNNLHGDVIKSAHGDRNYEGVAGRTTCPESNCHMGNGPKDSGHVSSCIKSVQIDGAKDSGPEEVNRKSNNLEDYGGPPPCISLGKRNRTERSPPSLGSLQGPTQKLFCQSDRSESVPIDLNTPVGNCSDSVDNIEDLTGGVDVSPHNIFPADMINGPSPVPDGSDTRDDSDIQRLIRAEVEATVQTVKLVEEEGVADCFQ
ncbi:hypothetical protein Hanom_Chr12g01176441 [Helianthus anomalus]